MPYVPVPKDLTKVKTKVLFNLTKRQLVCFAAAGALGLPVYFLMRGLIGNTAAVLVMIVAMLPFFLLAMYERDGQPAEQVLKNVLRCRIWPANRPYMTKNLYRTLTEKEDDTADDDNQKTGRCAAPPRREHQGRQADEDRRKKR